MNYKDIFDGDGTAKLIISYEAGVDVPHICANAKAREIFPTLDFEQDIDLAVLNLPISANELISGRSFERPFADDLKLSVRNIGLADQNTFELSFTEGRPVLDIDEELQILSSVFDTNDIGIFITDKQGVIQRINNGFSRLFGWEPQDVVGKGFYNFIAVEDRERAIRTHKKFVDRGVKTSGELRITNFDGAVSDTLCTTTILKLKNNKTYQVTTIIDLTIRKKIEQSLRVAKDEAESSSRAKSTFLANMSHELRTPLNAIIGFSEMFISQMFGAVGHKKYEEYSHDIYNSACHLLEIINEILDMSQIEAGGIQLSQEEVDVGTLFESVQRMLAVQATEKNISMIVDVDPVIETIRIDERLVRQALLNVMGNALKYSEVGGRITIHSYLNEKNDIAITISDTGQGIPIDKIQHVLKPFGRVEDAFKSNDTEGTGLGLPIAKGMIEMHGGELSISSSPEKGTVVEMILPAHCLIRKSGNTFASFFIPKTTNTESSLAQ